MITPWAAQARRLAALESEMATLRATLAETQDRLAQFQSRLSDTDATSVAERDRLEGRLTPLEARVEAQADAVRHRGEQVESLAEDMRQAAQAITDLGERDRHRQADGEKLHRAVAQAERRIELHTDEMDIALRGLIERMEAHLAALGLGKAGPPSA